MKGGEIDLASRVHPELREAFLARTPSLTTEKNMAEVRQRILETSRMARKKLGKVDGVSVTKRQIPGFPGDPDITISLYQPAQRTDNMPAVLSLHGGGMMLCGSWADEYENILTADRLTCMVIAPEYRLAPEHPFPCGLNDCYAALLWLDKTADALGVNRRRMAVSGNSAGGGLAAATAILARNKNGPQLCAQFLKYPMLDCRSITPSSKEITDRRVWSRQQSMLAWQMYLGQNGQSQVSALASPALLQEFTGLPPAFILVGSLDVFRDECIQYANNLLTVGIDVELHVLPGVFHGAEGLIPTSEIAKKMSGLFMSAMEHWQYTGHF